MLYVILFVLGLCFGSFGSVITYRLGGFSLGDIREGKKEFLNALKTIALGRSKCTSCQHTLHTKDLIPIISFIANKGQCAYCGKKIGWTYPLLEIGSGLLFVRVGYFALQTDMTLIQVGLRICVSRLLYLLMIYDIQKGYLHESIRALSALGTIGLLSLSKGLLRYYAIQWAFIFLVFFIGIYYFARLYVWIRRKKKQDGFGIGDVWLSPIVGGLFGLLQIRHTTSPLMMDGIALFQRYIILTGVTGLLYAGGQKLFIPQKSIREIPFFPGMIMALWVVMALL